MLQKSQPEKSWPIVTKFKLMYVLSKFLYTYTRTIICYKHKIVSYMYGENRVSIFRFSKFLDRSLL
jgi:hypothetical protein